MRLTLVNEAYVTASASFIGKATLIQTFYVSLGLSPSDKTKEKLLT